ncbi:MAG: S41 family peptidase, partial [Flavisolibacter sp.]
YFDKVSVDWDSLYMATIPRVVKAGDTKAYYDLLRQFAAQLNDGHTGVWYPSSFYQNQAAYAPLSTDLIERRVFITAIPDDSLKAAGWQKGMEILKVNGTEVHEYAMKNIKPFESASTPQGLDAAMYNLYLLNGPITEPVRLTVKGIDGQVKEKTLWRRTRRAEPPAVQYSILENNIGLLSINSFSSNNFFSVFDSLYKKIQGNKALIIDLRANTGGNGAQGEYILKHLTKTPFPDPQISARQYNPLLKVWGQNNLALYTILPGKTKPFSDRAIYEKPVVVLTGRMTASAAEDFTVQLDVMKRGMIIGQPTAGTTGQPMFSTLPGGGTLRVCIRKDTYPDGKEFVGIGIQPTVLVTENAAAFLKGEDPVLKKALQLLQ